MRIYLYTALSIKRLGIWSPVDCVKHKGIWSWPQRDSDLFIATEFTEATEKILIGHLSIII
jgi:hypothetical protein